MRLAQTILMSAGLLFGGVTVATAQDPQGTRVNVRGVVTAFEGTVLTVKTKAGAEIKVDVPEAASIATTKPFTMAEVTPGMILGVTTIKRADGQTVAIDLRPIPATAPQGLSQWDLAPESTMTNGAVEGAVTASANQELTINYKTGAVKVLVVPETAMSQAVPGARADIRVGETVFVFARKSADEKFTAARVQVSKDGVKPTQ